MSTLGADAFSHRRWHTDACRLYARCKNPTKNITAERKFQPADCYKREGAFKLAHYNMVSLSIFATNHETFEPRSRSLVSIFSGEGVRKHNEASYYGLLLISHAI